ncbi:MAG: hypothetical protein RI900_559 [Actinomycetota bacterium]
MTLVGANVVGGLLEACFLIVVTRLAFAVTDGRDRFGVLAGWEVALPQGILLAAGLVALRFVFTILSAKQSSHLTVEVSLDARVRLMTAYLSATWESQSGDRLGRLQELLTTFTQRVSDTVQWATSWLAASLNLMALLVTAVAVDPVASLAVILGVGVLSFALRPIRSGLRRQAAKTLTSGMRYATLTSEYSQAAVDLHVFHVQKAVEDHLRREATEASRQNERLAYLRTLNPGAYSALAYVALLGALWAASSVKVVALTSVGPVMLVMLRSLSYGQAMQMSGGALQSTFPFVEALDREMEHLAANQVVDGGEPIGSLGALSFEDVGYAYADGVPVLTGLDFTLQPGEIVGVVGPSGSGKSTMVQLMLGLRSPTVGRVTANGRDIAGLAREEWARKVTFVPQQAHLIAGTVADNIRFLRPGVSDADVEAAARLANLHGDVSGWSEGYQRFVGEAGSHLSGGQQQRLVIARALVERPELMVLDEPTSALDAESEFLVRESLQQLRGRVAVVIIAHRLTTLDMCDRIMVLHGGVIQAFDSPAALARDNEFYQRVLRLSSLE